MTPTRKAVYSPGADTYSRIDSRLLPAFIGDGYKTGFPEKVRSNMSKGMRYAYRMSDKRRTIPQKLMHNTDLNIMKFVLKHRAWYYMSRGWKFGVLPSVLQEVMGKAVAVKENRVFMDYENPDKFWRIVDPDSRVYVIKNLKRFLETRSIELDTVTNPNSDWLIEAFMGE